jgi:hypothetical protein
MITTLDKLKAKKAQLEARIQAETTKDKVRERKLETRRKIVIGGTILSMIKSGEMGEERLLTMLDKHCKNVNDRSLFKLSDIEDKY